MRSFKWQALFAAAMFAVPTLVLAQSEINVRQNENQNENQNEGQNDPFYATPDSQPRVKKLQTRLDKPIKVQTDVRIDRKDMVYTRKALQLGRLTDSVGISISSVPPAMAAQLRLQPGVGVVVEQIAPGSAIESAGIEQYDVIEKVDGHAIHQPQDLTQTLRGSRSDSVSIDIIRQAHRQSISVDANQLRHSKTFSFNGPKPFGGTAGFEFRADGKNFNTNDDLAERSRDNADREREKADKEREKADRNRERDLERAQRDRDRQNSKRDMQNGERDQINAMREQIKQQLDRERGELDKAREQLNRATQEMNQRLTELRVKLDTEVRQKLENELRKGQDQIREKMELLEKQTRDLQSDDSKDDQNGN